MKRNVSRIARLAIGTLFVLAAAPRSDAGDLVLAWDPPSDGITIGYLLSYGVTPGTYSQQVNVGYATSYTLSGLLDGTTYYFVVRAYDAAGDVSDPSAEVAATVPPSIAPVVTALALSSNLPSPQALGTTVSWLSTATGGVAPYEFQWSLYKAGSWTVWPWASASTWTWIPSTAASDYQVRVAVRSSGSSSAAGEMTQSMPFTITAPKVSSATLGSNVPAPQVVGTTVLWSAGGAGGVAPYQYKWWVYDGKTWTAATGWTTSSTWSWTPTAANNSYSVRVWIRSAGSVTDAAETSASVPFAIKSKTLSCRGWKCR